MGRVLRRRIACFALASLAVACQEPIASEPIARGKQVYRALDCGRCHHIDRSGGRLGPELTRVGAAAATRRPGVAAEEYLRESILDPGAYIVPTYVDSMPRGLARGLSDNDLEALVAYLASLR